jgi:hypothetical protein
LPLACGSLLTASSGYRFSRRFGRQAILAGITGLLAGLGNGLAIAPSQDFVLGSAPRQFWPVRGSESAAKVMPSLVHTAQTTGEQPVPAVGQPLGP